MPGNARTMFGRSSVILGDVSLRGLFGGRVTGCERGRIARDDHYRARTARNMPGICPDCPEYAQNMPKICPVIPDYS